MLDPDAFHDCGTVCQHVFQFHNQRCIGDHVGTYILKAFIPYSHQDKTRFQITVEIEHGTGNWLRPHALRAASGQLNWILFDPTRFAAPATDQLF